METIIYYSPQLNHVLNRDNIGFYTASFVPDRDYMMEHINHMIAYALRDAGFEYDLKINYIQIYHVVGRKKDIPKIVWKRTIEKFDLLHKFSKINNINFQAPTIIHKMWHDVNEQLPEIQGAYLCKLNDHNIIVANVNFRGDWMAYPGGQYFGDVAGCLNKNPDYIKVTHWAHLPKFAINNENF